MFSGWTVPHPLMQNVHKSISADFCPSYKPIVGVALINTYFPFQTSSQSQGALHKSLLLMTAVKQSSVALEEFCKFRVTWDDLSEFGGKHIFDRNPVLQTEGTELRICGPRIGLIAAAWNLYISFAVYKTWSGIKQGISNLTANLNRQVVTVRNSQQSWVANTTAHWPLTPPG